MRPRAVISTVLLLTMFFTQSAFAWGPDGRIALIGISVKQIRAAYSEAFNTVGTDYQRDVLRGALKGVKALNESHPSTTNAETIGLIGHEIQLLREVRKYGVGSYFSFRMGVLASMSSDVVLPFAHPETRFETEISARVAKDIDAHVKTFRLEPVQPAREYMHDVGKYFEKKHKFFADAKDVISLDYSSGVGYDGYLKASAQEYFRQAVQSITDTWNTVLRHESEGLAQPPSAKIVTWYFVNEIEYLLKQKKNVQQANKTYRNFRVVNPGISGAYEKIGDLYYAFGTEDAKERGVREWRLALGSASSGRQQVAVKIAEHYISLGETHLKASKEPQHSDTLLPKAISAFKAALETDRMSDRAADRLSEANTAYKEEQAAIKKDTEYIATARQVMVKAQNDFKDGNYKDALINYKSATTICEMVSNQFIAPYAEAEKAVREIQNNERSIIEEIIERAYDNIESGDQAFAEGKYDESIRAYEAVPITVSVIPADEGSTQSKEKRDLEKMAAEKIVEAKREKDRYMTTQAANAGGAQ